MARTRETLSTLFAPPSEDLHGVGGVLCAYSAEADFLEKVLTQFTGVSKGSRIARGSLDLTLLLDPNHAVAARGIVPGLLQLYPLARKDSPVPSAHLHAKVALLAFAEARAGRPSIYRLLVSSGNWTHESAVQRIEMVWRLDVEVGKGSDEDRRELWAVAAFLERLMTGYQCGARLTKGASALLTQAVADGRKPSGANPTRFVSSLMPDSKGKLTALWPQVRDRIANAGTAYNLLVCGSGSYERARPEHRGEPAVLLDIATELVTRKALTKSAEKAVVANSDGMDQVRASFVAGQLGDWTLCKPKDPSPSASPNPRALHAKFLFVGRSQGTAVHDGRLYLGSGNLSQPGFLRPPPQGNIEAGVLLDASALRTEARVKALLPWGSAYKKSELNAPAAKEVEEPELSEFKPPPPILAFEVMDDGRVRVAWDAASPKAAVDALLADGPVTVAHGQEWLSPVPTPLPRFIDVRAQNEVYKVPCLTASGEFVRQADAPESFESWLDQLCAFPGAWNDPAEDEDPDDDGPEGQLARDGVAAHSGVGRDFPARKAMLLVEAIAERNGDVAEGQAPDWLAHLRHLLRQVPGPDVEGWRALRVNFLSVLLSKDGFAPDWDDTSAYQMLIDETALRWGLSEYPTFDVNA